MVLHLIRLQLRLAIKRSDATAAVPRCPIDYRYYVIAMTIVIQRQHFIEYAFRTAVHRIFSAVPD